MGLQFEGSCPGAQNVQKNRGRVGWGGGYVQRVGRDVPITLLVEVPVSVAYGIQTGVTFVSRAPELLTCEGTTPSFCSNWRIPEVLGT